MSKNGHIDNEPLTQERMVTLLDEIYGIAIRGIPKVSKSVDQLADDYLSHCTDQKKAAKKLINNQVAKCGTSGFLTGLGGLITLPVTLPANITSVLYVQIRMIAAVAKIGGFDIQSDQVQTMVYACLTGQAISDVIKQTGIKVGEKFAVAAIEKIPGKALIEVNKKVGFRLVTKAGTKGIVNMGKLVPIAGGIIGGIWDITSTRIIAANAYSVFIKNLIPAAKSKNDTSETEVFDMEFEDISEEHDYVIVDASDNAIPCSDVDTHSSADINE